jgi:hypothetical protein
VALSGGGESARLRPVKRLSQVLQILPGVFWTLFLIVCIFDGLAARCRRNPNSEAKDYPMKKLWNLLRFWASRTPKTALALIESFRPENWKMTVDGAAVARTSPLFSLDVRGEKLTLALSYQEQGGALYYLTARSRFKNDGSDELTIAGVPMSMDPQGFDFDAQLKQLRVEMRYRDPAGIAHEIVFSTN